MSSRLVFAPRGTGAGLEPRGPVGTERPLVEEAAAGETLRKVCRGGEGFACVSFLVKWLLGCLGGCRVTLRTLWDEVDGAGRGVVVFMVAAR
jgi:hypothetical protein